MITLMEKEILEQAQILPSILKNNAEVYGRIAQDLKNKKIPFVIIAARGTSDNAAIFGKYAIEAATGIPVVLAAPSVSTVYSRPYKAADAMIIGISQSGEAADVLSVITDGKRNGALTLAITNNPASALACEAKYHLDCGVGAEISVAATKTFTAELLLLAGLMALLSPDADFGLGTSRLAEDLKICIGLKDELFKLAYQHKHMEACFTLSRGYDYCIALESALKMQECAYVKSHAFSLADFMHGPISLIESDTHCFLFCRKGLFENEYIGLLERLRDIRARVTVFTDNVTIKSMADNVIEVPRPSHQVLSPIYFAVAAQLYACGLSLAKGLNPDCPRNLRKVTITK